MEWKEQIQTGTMSAVIEGLTSVSDNSELRVVLHTGHQLVGVPLKCDLKNGLFLFQIRTNPPAEIAWIPFSSVCYLHLVNPSASMKGITGGKVTRDPSSAGVPSLELKRKAAKVFEGMKPSVNLEWPATIGGPESLGISDFIDSLKSVIESLAQDPMGKEALAGIQKISVSTSGDITATAAQGTLSITFPAAMFDLSQKQKLLSIIEQAL